MSIDIAYYHPRLVYTTAGYSGFKVSFKYLLVTSTTVLRLSLTWLLLEPTTDWAFQDVVLLKLPVETGNIKILYKWLPLIYLWVDLKFRQVTHCWVQLSLRFKLMLQQSRSTMIIWELSGSQLGPFCVLLGWASRCAITAFKPLFLTLLLFLLLLAV